MIPRIIHQTWKSTYIPSQLDDFYKHMKMYHTDWTIYLWTDMDMVEFIKNNYPHYLSLYVNFPLNIQRCDFFRYLTIYHFGGFYLDLDIYIYKSLDCYLDRDICLFTEHTLTRYECIRLNFSLNETERIGNYAFGAIPKHSFFLNVIKNININNNEIHDSDDVHKTTGSGLITTLFHITKPCKSIMPTTHIDEKYLCKCKRQYWCRVGDCGTHYHMCSWLNLSENIDMSYIILNAMKELKIDVLTVKNKHEIIINIISKYPFIKKEYIEKGLLKI